MIYYLLFSKCDIRLQFFILIGQSLIPSNDDLLFNLNRFQWTETLIFHLLYCQLNRDTDYSFLIFSTFLYKLQSVLVLCLVFILIVKLSMFCKMLFSRRRAFNRIKLEMKEMRNNQSFHYSASLFISLVSPIVCLNHFVYTNKNFLIVYWQPLCHDPHRFREF